MEVLERTASIIVENEKIKPIPAAYIKEGENIFLVKFDKNGNIIEKEYIGKYWWWEHIHKFSTEETGKINPLTRNKGCPLSCGLCNIHKNNTALLNIVVTNRCELQCWYCFFYAERAGYIYEPSLEEILEMVDRSKEANGRYPAVQLTGGEPLLREDLLEIIKALRKKGIPHIQLNTSLVQLGILAYNSMDNAIDYVRELRKAGLNTIYTSFDGVDPKVNFKNHYELPFALEALKEGGVTSVVLVPTLIRGYNFPNELKNIILFALKHREVIRGVNFQPISFVGQASTLEREQQRVTISDLIEELEKQLGIPRFSWYPIPIVVPLLKALGKENLGFHNNPKCGMATYIRERNGRIESIIEYLDVEKIYNALRRFGKLGLLSFLVYSKGDLRRDVLRLAIKRDYDSAGKLHYDWTFLGVMHFMDWYNYDIKRVQRCCIHYGLPDGRIVPFCSYNVFPWLYRDKIFKQYAIKDEHILEKLRSQTKEAIKRRAEFRSKINEIRRDPIYQKYYQALILYQ